MHTLPDGRLALMSDIIVFKPYYLQEISANYSLQLWAES